MSIITLELRDEKLNKKEILFENEYGIGLYLLAFNKYNYNFQKKIYFFQNSVVEAKQNINRLLNYINLNKKNSEFYDDWTLHTLNNVEHLFNNLLVKLDTTNETDYLISDYVANIINYSLETSIIHPQKLINENKYWIMNLIEGNFNHKYLSYKESLEINKFIKNFIFDIKDLINIKMLSTCKKSTILPIGESRLLRFSLEFNISKSRQGEGLEQLLYPILEKVHIYELGYEQINLDKWKEDIIEIMFYKILNK